MAATTELITENRAVHRWHSPDLPGPNGDGKIPAVKPVSRDIDRIEKDAPERCVGTALASLGMSGLGGYHR